MIDEANEAECAINRVLTTLVNLEVLGKSLVLENSGETQNGESPVEL